MGFFIFISILFVFIVLVDFYFLKSWKRFVKFRNWKKGLYRVPFYIAIGMVFASVYILGFRARDPIKSPFLIFMYSLLIIWYFPKILVFPFLLLKDIYRLLKALYNKLFNSVAVERSAAEVKIDQKRRTIIKTAGWGLASVPFIYVANGLIRTTHNVWHYKEAVYVKDLPEAFEGLRIAQVSDIHAGSFANSSMMEKAYDIISGIKPDLILVTGDFVNFNPEEMKIIKPVMDNFSAKYGVFGILGNHDHYMTDAQHRELIAIIKDSPVDLLINEHRRIDINGEQFQLAGIDNLGFRQTYGDIDKALEGLDENNFLLLMSHDPTSWDKYIVNKKNIDLTLSGHTHGGQVGIELFGKDLSPAEIAYEQWAGLYKKGNQNLYVNRGLGTTGPPIRLALQPEITEIILKKA